MSCSRLLFGPKSEVYHLFWFLLWFIEFVSKRWIVGWQGWDSLWHPDKSNRDALTVSVCHSCFVAGSAVYSSKARCHLWAFDPPSGVGIVTQEVSLTMSSTGRLMDHRVCFFLFCYAFQNNLQNLNFESPLRILLVESMYERTSVERSTEGPYESHVCSVVWFTGTFLARGSDGNCAGHSYESIQSKARLEAAGNQKSASL